MSSDAKAASKIDLSVRRLRSRAPSDGQSKVWLVGGGLAICLTLIVGLFSFILMKGMSVFWPQPIDLLLTNDGGIALGEKVNESDDTIYYRVGNLDLTGRQYQAFRRTDGSHATGNQVELGDQVTESEVSNDSRQPIIKDVFNLDAVVQIERQQWGTMYGVPLMLQEDLRISTLPWNSPTLSRLRHLRRIRDLLLQSESAPQTLASSLTNLELRVGDQVLREELKRAQAASGGSFGNCNILVRGETHAWPSADKRIADTATTGQDLDASRWVALTDLDDLEGELILGGFQRWESIDGILVALPERISKVRAINREMEQVREGMVRLDVRLDALQRRVGYALLEIDASASSAMDRWLSVLRRETHLRQEIRSLVFTRGHISKLLVDNPLQTKWQNWIDRETETRSEEIERLNRENSRWSQSQNSETAVALHDEFIDRAAAILQERASLSEKLTSLQKTIQRWQLILAVTSGSRVASSDESELETTANANQVVDERLRWITKPNDSSGVSSCVSIWQVVSGSDVDLNDAPEIGERRTRSYDFQNLAELRTAYLRIASGEQGRDGTNYRLMTHVEPLQNVINVLATNRLGWRGSLVTYADRWREFLFDNPREANTSGGMFPAIWGTVVLTLMMTMAVVPFGVIAALYLREYTSEGPLVSLIRISIHNLAGVPSIVYGVFGVAFFCYTVGAFIDGGPVNADIEPLSAARWYLLFGLTSLIGGLAFFSTFAFARTGRGVRQWLSRSALVLWLICLTGIAFLIFRSPFFEGFFVHELPDPTFGKGGILWAALTLALLTLPIVIVSTEEALVRVPNSLRIGSSACGANKWQTIQRVVFPHALPGIATGALLAMSRGAGQVAPLMLVGALPSVADLPLDNQFPFLHGSRSFMHLGYQIYSLGLKSGDAQATEPFVFAAILLLLTVVCVLHLIASALRSTMVIKRGG